MDEFLPTYELGQLGMQALGRPAVGCALSKLLLDHGNTCKLECRPHISAVDMQPI
jgi:hypothetical protein